MLLLLLLPLGLVAPQYAAPPPVMLQTPEDMLLFLPQNISFCLLQDIMLLHRRGPAEEGGGGPGAKCSPTPQLQLKLTRHTSWRSGGKLKIQLLPSKPTA